MLIGRRSRWKLCSVAGLASLQLLVKTMVTLTWVDALGCDLLTQTRGDLMLTFVMYTRGKTGLDCEHFIKEKPWWITAKWLCWKHRLVAELWWKTKFPVYWPNYRKEGGQNRQSEKCGWRFLKVHTSGYYIRKFWGCNVQQSDYSWQYRVACLKVVKRVNLKNSQASLVTKW